jgi:23S rRNA G2069 N7-methylase RlmK/C1962 C5-methylase RlmI
LGRGWSTESDSDYEAKTLRTKRRRKKKKEKKEERGEGNTRLQVWEREVKFHQPQARVQIIGSPSPHGTF